MRFADRIGNGVVFCRDKGRGWVDEGALCLSSSECDPSASRNPDESHCHEDKHKAPTHLRVHPLSLQDGGGWSQANPVFGRHNSLESSCLWNNLATKYFQGSQFMSIRHIDDHMLDTRIG